MNGWIGSRYMTVTNGEFGYRTYVMENETTHNGACQSLGHRR